MCITPIVFSFLVIRLHGHDRINDALHIRRVKSQSNIVVINHFLHFREIACQNWKPSLNEFKEFVWSAEIVAQAYIHDWCYSAVSGRQITRYFRMGHWAIKGNLVLSFLVYDQFSKRSQVVIVAISKHYKEYVIDLAHCFYHIL